MPAPAIIFCILPAGSEITNLRAMIVYPTGIMIVATCIGNMPIFLAGSNPMRTRESAFQANAMHIVADRNELTVLNHFFSESPMRSTPAARDRCFLSREVIIPPINVIQRTMC